MQNFNYGGMQGCGGYNYGMQPQAQRNEYAFVDGVESAKAYRVPFGTMMLLMDSNMPVCYKKQVDAYGRTVDFKIYDLVEHVDKPPVEYVTKDEFKAFIDSLNVKKE